MSSLSIFVVLSTIVTVSSGVLKKLVKSYRPDITCGLLFGVILGLLASFAYGKVYLPLFLRI